MDNKKEQTIAVIFSIIGSLAILINLAIKGFSTENILDSIKDLVGLLVTVAVFLVAYSISNKSKSYGEIARSSLKKIQVLNSDFLMGPRFNRDNYDPEKGKGVEYLFITNNDPKSNQRAKFIPIQPLDEGILAIFIQKGTLVYGLNYSSDKATPDEITKIQTAISNSLTSFVQNKYTGLYDILKTVKDDTAIIIDFNEEKMGKKNFAKAIRECTELVLVELKNNKH